MKYLLIALVAFFFTACTTVEKAPAPTVITNVVKKPEAIDRDIAAEVILMCDRLGFKRQDEGWRLCAMRGMDRYIDPRNGTVLEQLHRNNESMQERFEQQQRQYQPQLQPGSYYIPPQPQPYYSTPYPPHSLPGYPNYPVAK